MTKNVSFNFTSNFSINGKKQFSTSVDDSRDLTPQQEYWLNRLLRDYGNKVFIIAFLFLLLIGGVIYLTSVNGQSMQNGGAVNIQLTQ